MDPFLIELQELVKNHAPQALWEWHDHFVVLQLVPEKTICCSLSEQTTDLSLPKCQYYVTQTLWKKHHQACLSRFYSLLGVTKRIHGRLCQVKKIDKILARDFVDQNHAMGYTNSPINMGLFYQNKLVAVACFSKGRRLNRLPPDLKSFELIRFCNVNYYTVVGGLSKLLAHFESEYHPGDIMTYVDSNWGEPHNFYALGFSLHEMTHTRRSAQVISTPTHVDTFTQNYKLIRPGTTWK